MNQNESFNITVGDPNCQKSIIRLRVKHRIMKILNQIKSLHIVYLVNLPNICPKFHLAFQDHETVTCSMDK